MAQAELGLYAAALVAAVLVLLGYGLHWFPSTVVLSLDYVDGVHSVTLLQALCRGRSAASLGDNIYTYIEIVNGSARGRGGVSLSVLVSAVSNESRVCGCGTVLRGPVPPGAGSARLAGSSGAGRARGLFFAAFRLDNGAVTALLALDKYLFDVASGLYTVVGLFSFLVAVDMCSRRRWHTLGDAATVSLGVFVLGLGLLSLLLYLHFSGFSLMLAYTVAVVGLGAASVWTLLLLFKNVMRGIESMRDVVLFTIIGVLLAFSIVAAAMSLGDFAVLLQALDVLVAGRSLVGLVSSIVSSLVVYGVFQVYEARDCRKLRRLLAGVSTMLVGIGLVGLTVYEPLSFLYSSRMLLFFPLFLVPPLLALWSLLGTEA